MKTTQVFPSVDDSVLCCYFTHLDKTVKEMSICCCSSTSIRVWVRVSYRDGIVRNIDKCRSTENTCLLTDKSRDFFLLLCWLTAAFLPFLFLFILCKFQNRRVSRDNCLIRSWELVWRRLNCVLCADLMSVVTMGMWTKPWQPHSHKEKERKNSSSGNVTQFILTWALHTKCLHRAPNDDDRYNCVCAYIIQYLSIESLTSCWNASQVIGLTERINNNALTSCTEKNSISPCQSSRKKEAKLPKKKFHWIKSCVQFESSMIRQTKRYLFGSSKRVEKLFRFVDLVFFSLFLVGVVCLFQMLQTKLDNK